MIERLMELIVTGIANRDDRVLRRGTLCGSMDRLAKFRLDIGDDRRLTTARRADHRRGAILRVLC